MKKSCQGALSSSIGLKSFLSPLSLLSLSRFIFSLYLSLHFLSLSRFISLFSLSERKSLFHFLCVSLLTPTCDKLRNIFRKEILVSQSHSMPGSMRLNLILRVSLFLTFFLRTKRKRKREREREKMRSYSVSFALQDLEVVATFSLCPEKE